MPVMTGGDMEVRSQSHHQLCSWFQGSSGSVRPHFKNELDELYLVKQSVTSLKLRASSELFKWDKSNHKGPHK